MDSSVTDAFTVLSGLSAAVQAITSTIQLANSSPGRVGPDDFEPLTLKAIADAERLRERPHSEEAFWMRFPTVERPFRDKVEEILKGFEGKMRGAKSQGDWARVADELNSDICAVLRSLKGVSGGVLPGSEWYELWTRHRCA